MTIKPVRILWRIVLFSLLLGVILLPFLAFGAPMEAWMAGVMQRVQQHPRTAFWLVAGFLASDILLPVPSSIVSTLGGAALGAVGGTLASWSGMMVSCALGFWLGRVGRSLGRRLAGDEELARLEKAESRFGAWMIVVARPVPVLAEASTILAGMGKMHFFRFLVMSAIANLAVSAVYAVIGGLSRQTNAFLPAFGTSLLLAGVAMLIGRRRRV